MDPIQAASEAKTWVDFAFTVWHDVWGYAVSTGVGLFVGALFPQLKLPFRKPPVSPSE